MQNRVKFIILTGNKYPNLGERGGEGRSSWIKAVSRGGLFTPSQSLLLLLNSLEDKFKEYHGEKLNSVRDPIGQFALITENENPEIPGEILRLFSKTRFFIRLKHLNKETQVLSAKKRHVQHVSKYKY